MFGTTKDFLDYFGLKKLEDLPTLADIKDGLPELSPQTDLVDSLEVEARGVDVVVTDSGENLQASASVAMLAANLDDIEDGGDEDDEDDGDDDADLAGPDLVAEYAEDDRETNRSQDDGDDAEAQSDNVIPLRAADDEQ
jgi:segregation and condensation protein B